MKDAKKIIVILGAGESGIGAALLAQQKGFEVFVSDYGQIEDENKTVLSSHKIAFEEGQHTLDKIHEAHLVVKSPGIPDHIKLIKDLLAKGIPVISEIEFAAQYTKAKIIGITGSNGKTTTTRLISHILLTAGQNIGMAGNVGPGFARSLSEGNEKEIYVLELSSFQLDGIVNFRANIALLLNISPDHLDRYDYQLSKYIDSKFRITMNQQKQDLFLYNAEDEHIKEALPRKEIKAQRLTIEKSMVKKSSVQIDNHEYLITNPSLKGPHNLMNAGFAIQTARLLDVEPVWVQKALDSFVNVPHRLELVKEVKGVPYYNDSKATNVDAVFYALQSIERNIIWIVGGEDKGNDYDVLLPLVKERVKTIICMGIDNSKIISAFEHLGKPVFEALSAHQAVEIANQQAVEGDTVLLSPACASFDLFDNYKDRGNKFKKAVEALK